MEEAEKASQPHAGTALAFDFGEKRIGVAIGNLELGLAHPLVTLSNKNKEECLKSIARLMDEWKPVLLVVGLPVHADGTEHELTRRSRRFAHRLQARFGIRTVLEDERYTSISASSALDEASVRSRRQKQVLDQIAAQLILQSYFDQRNATT
ncbi:Holliday junction resolvase RuvX [Nitrosospira multiformis]|uniref:Holliday junction resolvase RuvX n=1 Tax=Nitrosospira multiformis TaxID=1231 RepID=UPI00089AB275|nr:Holliday junction resolvase RuvX [Nitrosospira multiformis]SEA13598.1 putative holliday junction resolvase [Nitrosospira multiformis]